MTSITTTSKNITRKMTEIENLVTKRLLSFYNKEIQPFAKLMPAESLRRIHEDKVKAIIRKAIQDAYVSGTEIVGDKINERVQFDTFISQTDMGNIVKLTNTYNDTFWRMVGRLVQRENEFVVVDNELEKKKSFDTEAAITGVSSDLAFGAFNESIISKMKEALVFVHDFAAIGRAAFAFRPLAQEFPAVANLFGPMLGGTAEFPSATEIPEEEFPTAEFLLDLTKLGGKIMFLTKEDEKVDEELCAPLNRTEYEVDDPAIPLPPLHRYCRCRLVPILQETIQ